MRKATSKPSFCSSWVPNPEHGSPWVPPNSLCFNFLHLNVLEDHRSSEHKQLPTTLTSLYLDCFGWEQSFRSFAKPSFKKAQLERAMYLSRPFSFPDASLTGPGQKGFLQEEHSCLPPPFPPPSYQRQEHTEETQRKTRNFSGLPSWSDTLLKPQKSEERDVFTCFDVIYRTQSIGSGLQRGCRKGERKISPEIHL